MSILELYDLAVIRCRLSSAEGLMSMETERMLGEDGGSSTGNSSQTSGFQHKNMITEMRAQNYDVIRFATYRTACKLRFIQKKTYLHLVDIWNMIEAFRENGLNCVDQHSEINVSRLETILSSIYYHLNKRLPTNQQIDANTSITLLLNWLLAAYDPERKGKVQIFSMKVALTTLCSGKLMDKLRYIFTQISDSSGFLMAGKFDSYLKEVSALPTVVFEGPSFGYNASSVKSCFDGKNKVNVNDFLDVLMTDPAPQCVMWLPIFHRMSNAESVLHPVQCEGCHRESFMGFRYKCQRCYNYHLCQDCFWRGRISGNHSNDHEVKEYTSYKSPAKEIGRSLRKSFRCVPSHSNHRIPYFPDTPEKTFDLTYIVPATPVFSHNGFNDNIFPQSLDLSSLDNSSSNKSPSKAHSYLDSSRIDDEHRLIARYAARLAADSKNVSLSPAELNFNLDATKPQEELIMQLEAKNREIMKEIQRLRVEQEAMNTTAESTRNPTLLAELLLLRQRKDELESRMTNLQESRRELMVQLEGLMKLLKSHGSPRSTPNSSPRSRSAPPIPPPRTSSTPSTPGDSLSGLGGDVQQAFSQNIYANYSNHGNVRSLRNDLLVAADSVTNAMSSLVKELNSEASSGSEDDEVSKNKVRKDLYTGEESGLESTDEFAGWREELQHRLGEERNFIAELRARKSQLSDSEGENYLLTDDGESLSCIHTDSESLINTDDGEFMKTDDEDIRRTIEDAELYDQDPKELFQMHSSLRYTTDDESYLTDAESYIRTDEEEGGNTDWEDTMRRWVNR